MMTAKYLPLVLAMVLSTTACSKSVDAKGIRLRGIADSDISTADDISEERSRTVYFVRHAEQETTTLELGDATTAYNLQWPGSPGTGESPDITERDGDVVGNNFDQVCGNENCAEGLALQGVTRAHLLSHWMMENGIVDELTHVFSSHKRRTALTVEPTASLADLTVVQYPVDGEELNPEGNGPSICPTVEAIVNTPPGSVILVAAHTSTLYQIMDEGRDGCEGGIGLDLVTLIYSRRRKRGKAPKRILWFCLEGCY